MKNTKTWKFANNYSAMWMVRLGLIICLLALVVSGYSRSYETSEIVALPMIILALIASIIRTERALVKYADKIESGHA